MNLNPETKYPIRRAYVLKLRGDAVPGVIVGRLENMVTGRQREFSSAEELMDWIASDLVTGINERVDDLAGD